MTSVQEYDDIKRAEAEAAKNKKGVYKFSPESELAVTRMDDLKEKVKATEDKVSCLLNVQIVLKHTSTFNECM